MDVGVAAKLAELTVDEFRALNPQFGQHVVTGGTKTQILLPHDNADKFKANLSKWSTTLSSWTSYKVTGSRERVEAIATKYDTTPEIIREVNNIPPKMLLKAGSTILVPRPAKAADKDIAPDIAENATIDIESDVATTKRITIKASKRDTLASIAKRHHVSVAQIKSWNKLKSNTVATGTKLELHVQQKNASRKKGSKVANVKNRNTKKNITTQAKANSKPNKKKSG